mmetsp:Transcript_35385/g.106910  ORF Transcript_35385/g.106910 Transcript_35385/m.106910 type:complete len:202 (+) Transcript_35385:1-606(+)
MARSVGCRRSCARLLGRSVVTACEAVVLESWGTCSTPTSVKAPSVRTSETGGQPSVSSGSARALTPRGSGPMTFRSLIWCVCSIANVRMLAMHTRVPWLPMQAICSVTAALQKCPGEAPAQRSTRQLVSETKLHHRRTKKMALATFAWKGPPSSPPIHFLRRSSAAMASTELPLKTRTLKPRLRDSTTKAAWPLSRSEISG